MNDDFASREVVMSVLGAFAVQAHELFLEFVKAGFTEEQALKIVIGLTATD